MMNRCERLTVRVDHLRVGRNNVNCNLLRAESAVSQSLGIRKGDLLNDGGLVQTSSSIGRTGVLDEKYLFRGRIPATISLGLLLAIIQFWTHHVTASWKMGSTSEVAIRVSEGLVPIMS